MRIAINGMGRIGRLLFRMLLGTDFELVAVNDVMNIDNLAYLLKYDSLYGPLGKPVALEGNKLVCGEKRITVLQNEQPLQLPWKDMQIDLVLECSGKFTRKALAEQHL